ncbi:MAG: ABC transporter permease [Clostridia bacterium]|nr:ABC transporter permease [Clostridia bacterium]
MKRDMTKFENIKEEELNDINRVANAPEIDEKPPIDIPQQALDDERRVKVISPSVLVAKRFFRNKLALVGLAILIFMFAFCFLGGWIIQYNQKEVFYKNDSILFDYATATERTSYENYYLVDSNDIHYSVRNMLNSYIIDMEAQSQTTRELTDTENNSYTLKKLGDNIYSLEYNQIDSVATYSNNETTATYNSFLDLLILEEDVIIENESFFKSTVSANIETGSFSYSGDDFIITPAGTKNIYTVKKVVADGLFDYSEEMLGVDFENAVKANLSEDTFVFNDGNYIVTLNATGVFEISRDFGLQNALYATTFVFDCYDTTVILDNDFKLAAFMAVYGSTNFTYDERTFSIAVNEDDILMVSETTSGTAVPFANMSTFAVRRYNGEDTLSINFKLQLEDAVTIMLEQNITETSFTAYTVLLDENGEELVDELGNPIYGEAEFDLERNLSYFLLRNFQEKYLINIYDAPSAAHWLGTDANGMDVLTRIMFGGRISLMIGFIVIFISLFIGVILGGIAGYFGKWIDNIIMRLVDIFNCIPTLPILIILGAFFDAVRMDPYTRIMYLMIILGVLGWSGIARLVRGQILFLREQEFMIAAEATGIKVSRRIFRHLVPNVMPQLIVNATMGLGGIILTESTLSFLGLGAKYPLATWGAMINAVSNATAMIKYTYIWIPVGLLICLTVIAFNFVGDGLRDAFDPKMKR